MYNCITPIFACLYDLTHDEYQQYYETLGKDGYRLTQVDGYPTSNGTRYAGIWMRDNACKLTRASHGMTSDEYQDYFDDLNKRGYRPMCVSGYSDSLPIIGVVPKFASLFNDGSFRGMITHHKLSTADYQKKSAEYIKLGYNLIWINGYSDGIRAKYAAIWSKHGNKNFQCKINIPSANYQATYDNFTKKGYRIKVVSAFKKGNSTFFAGLWVKQDDYDPAGRHNYTKDNFLIECQKLANQDYIPVCISGYEEGNTDCMAGVFIKNKRNWIVSGRADVSLREFDKLVKTTMKTYQIPGCSLAIVRNKKLILARGYSLITEYEDPVYPTSLFRIASVTKTLTGAAIVKLEENKKLKFTDKLSNLIDLPGVVADSRMYDITVEHLLHHVGGWDYLVAAAQDSEFEQPTSSDIAISKALGISLPITQESIIRVMDGIMLDFKPGEDYNCLKGIFPYSNYGYMLLGRIIEEVSGVPYEQFVQTTLLAPLGIRRMRIGRSLIGDRLPGEVLYHTTTPNLSKNVMVENSPLNVMNQYGSQYNFANSAAHGGWVASAVDLVRFASELDDPNTCSILNADSVKKLFAEHSFGQSSSNSLYGCGWFVVRSGSNEGQDHGGSLEGTKTRLFRWKDSNGVSYNAAYLYNKNDGATDDNWNLMTKIKDIVNGITKWPVESFWDDYS